MTEGSNFAVESNWNWQFSPNFQFFCSLEKITSFFEIFWFFFEMAKGINCAVKSEWKSKVSQNVEKLFCFKKVDWFLEKKSWTVFLNG